MSSILFALSTLLAAHGCQLSCQAGVLANFEKEAGPTLNPCIVSRSGIGLPQLAGALRRRFLAETQDAWCSPQRQIDFVVRVLDEMGLRERLFAEPRPDRAAVLFAREFERPRNRNFAGRAARAREIYLLLGGSR